MRRRVSRLAQASSRAALGSILAWMCACGVPVAQTPLGGASELPVTRVVLYQNGVGYFERAGKVEGDVFSLQVRPSQINDLLKSLTVIDAGSGRAVSASLPLEENADRMLSELPEQVRDAGGLLQVLRLFRGARVQLEGDAPTVVGRVIGVENLQEESGKEVKADWRVSLKTSDGEVVVYPVEKIQRVLLEDATLSVGLERSLDVSLGEGGWKPIGLAIRLAGATPHRVLASYIVEMPRWKPAYRLVLKGGEQPLLQGWAVVDNVSGEHWQNVSLSLVSGTPISFKYNLHAPQYSERADLTPAGLPRAAAPPPSEAAGYAQAPAAPPPAPRPASPAASAAPAEARRAKGKKAGAGYGYSYEADPLNGPLDDEGVQGGVSDQDEPAEESDIAAEVELKLAETLERQGGDAAASAVGALFRYDVRDRVTIPDRSSTLVSIVNQRIAGEEVAYFRPELAGAGDTHPYRAVKFDNATGIALEKGPITVYSNGTFVGEGFVERMESGSTAFLTFAIDGQVTLDQKGGAREDQLRLLRIQNGQLVSESQLIQQTSYEVKNHRTDAIRAYVRSGKHQGWTLKNRPAGTVETPEALIVPIDVPAGGSAKLDVEWQQPVQKRIAVDTNQANELLQVYLGSGRVPPEVERQLRQLLELQSRISDHRKEEERLRKQRNGLNADSERVRENLNVLRRTRGNSALEQELARKLATLERELGLISGRQVQLSEAVAELEAKVKALIKDVSLDAEQSAR
jgi:hypothetical protein